MRETRPVVNLALFLLANTGQPFSAQRLTKVLAIPSVPQTLRYLEYLQDAYALFAPPKFRPSFKQRIITPSKYYAIDNGMRLATSPQDSPDKGARLENLVYLALRRRGQFALLRWRDGTLGVRLRDPFRGYPGLPGADPIEPSVVRHN